MWTWCSLLYATEILWLFYVHNYNKNILKICQYGDIIQNLNRFNHIWNTVVQSLYPVMYCHLYTLRKWDISLLFSVYALLCGLLWQMRYEWSKHKFKGYFLVPLLFLFLYHDTDDSVGVSEFSTQETEMKIYSWITLDSHPIADINKKFSHMWVTEIWTL